MTMKLTEKQIETLKSFLDDEKVPYEDTEGFELPKGKLGISKSPALPRVTVSIS